MTAAPAVTVRVPGKVMLAGEYSALNGAPALAATVGLDLTVTAVADDTRRGHGCVVTSALWRESQVVDAKSVAADFATSPLLQAVARGIKLYGSDVTHVTVQSDLRVEYGIGSSSALRLAVLAAIQDLSRQRRGQDSLAPVDLLDIARQALDLQREGQPAASGYDIATQWLGGLVVSETATTVSAWPTSTQRWTGNELGRLNRFAHVFIGGQGAPTSSTMSGVSAWLRSEQRTAALAVINEALRRELMHLVETDAAHDPLDLRRLLELTRQHRQLFASAPGFPRQLVEQMAQIPGWDTTWAMKTTGAGGEDAVLVFADGPQLQAVADALRQVGWHQLPAKFSGDGLRLMRSVDGLGG